MKPLVDPLSDLIAALSVRAGALSGLDAAGTWALRFEVHEHIKIGAVLTGSCRLAADDAEPVRLRAGDCYLQAARKSFRIAGDLDAAYQDGEQVYLASPSRIVRLGEDHDEGRTLILGGSVNFLDSTVALLLAGLPPVTVIRAGTPQARAIQPLLGMLFDEVSAVRLGTSAMSERLTEILFIQAMRALVTGPESPDGSHTRLRGWLGALGDPQIGGALLLMHRQAARRWTVAALGAAVGMSRAGFAARFKELVGMPPLVYLQRWRILAAAKELRNGDRTVASLAAEWGYASESSFSTAFKRVTGVPPTRYRSDPLAAAPPVNPAGWPADRFRPYAGRTDAGQSNAGQTNAQVS